MLGIPVALAVFGYGEWATHKYLLHGLGRDKKSRLSFHYHEHHQAVRRNGGYDPAYEGPVWSTPTQAREAIGLAIVALAHAPLFPIAPFYTATVWYCLYRYRRDHRRAHLDPRWARSTAPDDAVCARAACLGNAARSRSLPTNTSRVPTSMSNHDHDTPKFLS